MQPGTLNCAKMLEHRTQYYTKIPETCWNIGSNNTHKDICFSNNAGNTNTQQSV